MNAIILSYDNQWDTDGDLGGKITKIEELLTTKNQKLAALEKDLGDDTKITKLLEELEISNKKFTSLRIERDQISSEFASFKDKSAQAVDDLNSRVTSLQTELQDYEKSKFELSEKMSKSISIRSQGLNAFFHNESFDFIVFFHSLKIPTSESVTKIVSQAPKLSPTTKRKKLQAVDDVFGSEGIKTQSRRVPKRVERGSTEINHQMVQVRYSVKVFLIMNNQFHLA